MLELIADGYTYYLGTFRYNYNNSVSLPFRDHLTGYYAGDTHNVFVGSIDILSDTVHAMGTNQSGYLHTNVDFTEGSTTSFTDVSRNVFKYCRLRIYNLGTVVSIDLAS
jgi:hypothetical protein